jgi:hypothetical protein
MKIAAGRFTYYRLHPNVVFVDHENSNKQRPTFDRRNTGGTGFSVGGTEMNRNGLCWGNQSETV